MIEHNYQPFSSPIKGEKRLREGPCVVGLCGMDLE